jgi:hypothetical protein
MKSFKFLSNNNRPEFWKVGTGAEIPIRQIGTPHIYNIIDCLNDRGSMRIPDIYEGYTKSQWVQIMQAELNRRELIRRDREINRRDNERL